MEGENMDIHVIPCDAEALRRGWVRALCGQVVRDAPHAPPTCVRCLALDALDTTALENLRGGIQ